MSGHPRSAEWVRAHGMKRKIHSTVPGDKYVENIVTLDMMHRHGWNNVRGGDWSQMVIREPHFSNSEHYKATLDRSKVEEIESKLKDHGMDHL